MAETNASWFASARRVLPGGVDSPVRSFASVGGTPYTVAPARGATVTDVEGTTYVDYVQSYGASLLGHADPRVVDAIREPPATARPSARRPAERSLLAEAICERVGGVEQVRFVSSGTEAAMSAVRLARGATGRSKIVKFDGCYHGHADALLAAGRQRRRDARARRARRACQRVRWPTRSSSRTTSSRRSTATSPASSSSRSRRTWGSSRPSPGFSRDCATPATRVGALLVFDEVITGFRLGPCGGVGPPRRPT